LTGFVRMNPTRFLHHKTSIRLSKQ